MAFDLPFVVEGVVRNLVKLEVVPAVSEGPVGERVHLGLLAALEDVQHGAVVAVVPPPAVDPSVHLQLCQRPVQRLHLGVQIVPSQAAKE